MNTDEEEGTKRYLQELEKRSIAIIRETKAQSMHTCMKVRKEHLLSVLFSKPKRSEND